MARLNRFAAAIALAAAFSLAATPAMAREYHHWHRWHRDRIDGGDVLAGALILGGIAAIASAANKQDRQDREPVSPPPPVPNDRQGYESQGAQQDEGLDRIADTCAEAVEHRHGQVDSVEDVTRDDDGWSVSGVLQDGSGFDCRLGNDRQVLSVNYGAARGETDDAARDDDRAAPPPVDVQPDDDSAPPPGEDNRPVWHGDDQQPQAQPEPQDDGRYSTSNAPDFGQST